MPRYFFTIFDGRDYVDKEGAELADLNAAQVYAIQYAGNVLSSEAPNIRPYAGWHLEVTDEAGCVILRLDFNITPLSASEEVPATTIQQALHRPGNF